jgi:tight adherence protein B
VPGPAGRELEATARALALGAPTEDALERLRVRAGGGPWDTLVAAMLLQRDAGGDLAGLLRGSAAALEEADRLERDARAVTAQARFTGLLVSVLPLVAAALAELARPGYLGSLLRSPLTLWLGGCAVAFQLVALLMIQRLARVKA